MLHFRSDVGSLEDYELLMMLERYYLTLHQMAYPAPAGFQHYFISLAFRCLQMRFVKDGSIIK